MSFRASLRPAGLFLTANACLLAAGLGQTIAPAQAGQRPSLGPPAALKIQPKMKVANTIAGLGTIVTGGNSHTGGNAWVDYNGDYLPDLFITNGSTYPHYLFMNNGDGTFTDVSALVAKPDPTLETAGVACADIDNDGDTDIVLAVDNPSTVFVMSFNPIAGGPNLLYENQGDGTFIENAAGWGLVDARGWRNNTVNIADTDLDGFVDVYMGCWALNNGPYNRDNVMYRGDGTIFTAALAGTEAHGQDTLTALFWDADMDLDPDLYVGHASAFHSPPLLDCTDTIYSCGSGGNYTEVTYPGVGFDACANMGLDVGDIDNDGDWDLYCTDQYTNPPVPDGNLLYLGNPDGSLSPDISVASGTSADDSWPANFVDFDRDGWIDLWVGCAREGRQDYIYMNNRDLTFDDRTPKSWQVSSEGKGGSVADYDGDGDVDVFQWNDVLSGMPGAGESFLYRNDTKTPFKWIQFKLLGVTSNRDAIGATVFVSYGGQTQMRRVSGGDSAHSQQEQVLSFGVAHQTSVDVEVRWPSGVVQNFADMATEQFHVIDEVGGVLAPKLVGVSAFYDPTARSITVTARSNYGGRTSLEAEGLGPLTYDAAKTRFAGVFPADAGSLPSALSVRSDRGATRKVPVRIRGQKSR